MFDAEVVDFVDSTALQMLAELADDLARAHVQLSIAHGLGQVRDLLAAGESPHSIQLFPTVGDAIDSLRGNDSSADNEVQRT